MITTTNRLFGMAALVCLGAMCPSVTAQTSTFSTPAYDRYMYPFVFNGDSPTPRQKAKSFCSEQDPQFDDRDVEFLIAFDTSNLIAPGGPSGTYSIVSARLKVVIAEPLVFAYDPTYDGVATYRTAAQGGVADTDTGRPMELFAAAFRAPYTQLTYTATAPFSSSPPNTPPWVGVRYAYPVVFDAAGAAIDCSRSVRENFEAPPMAIGTVAGLTPGDLVPLNSVVSFNFDLTQPGVAAFVQQSLSAGRLSLLAASLHHAEPFGSGPVEYPVYWTMDGPAGVQPTLEITIGAPPCKADLDGSGSLDSGDYFAFLLAFAGGSPEADWDGSGEIDSADYFAFLLDFAGGC